MKSALIEKASQDKQQNQTTRTNINCIQNFMYNLKKNLITNYKSVK